MNKGRFTRLAFGIVFVCFLLSTFVSLWSLRVMADQNSQALSKTIAAGIYDTISAELSEPVTIARTMANDSFLIDRLRHEQDNAGAVSKQLLMKYLAGIRDGLNCQSAFLVSSDTRRYYAATGESKVIDPDNDSRDSWYADFMASGSEYALDVDLDEFGQDAWTVFVDARIEDERGALMGVCGVGIRMTGTQELIVRLEKDYGVKISLVDPEGLVKIDTDQDRIETDHIDGLTLSQSTDYDYRKLSGYRYVITKYVDKLGWYLVVTSDGHREVSRFIRVILLNVALCALVMVVLVLTIRIIANRTRTLTYASFIDQTTQLYNRRAFEEDKAAQSQPDGDFAYVTADVNGLKTVNDTLGHAAGDELIRGAADCLKACLGMHGTVYRIGGDEFAAMLRVPEGQLDDLLKKLDEKVAAWSGEQVDRLSISWGCATSREFPSESIAEIGRISDERMYAAKEAYYRESGKDRRRRHE